MSGLNRKQKIQSIITYIFLFIYVLLFVSFFILLVNFSKTQNNIDQNRVAKFKDDVEFILKTDEENRVTKFDSLLNQGYVQLAIVDQNSQKVYSNTNTVDLNLLKGSVSRDAIFYESIYQVKAKDEVYTVWAVFYNKIDNKLVTTLVTILLISFIVLCFIIVMLIRTSFSKIISPLKQLRNNILKLKDYKLSEVNSELEPLDVLSQNLEDFTVDLQGKMDKIGITYTQLEKELIAKEESMRNTQHIVSSLIHDLKTPLNTSGLMISLEREKNDNEFLVSLEKENDNILKSINEVLEVLYLENDYSKMDSIDLVLLIKDSLKKFKKLYKSKKIRYILDLPPSQLIYGNRLEIKSVIDNALSNIYNYSKRDSVFEVFVGIEDKGVVIKMFNEIDDVINIDFDNIFELFYRDETDNDAGSGLGMYIIREMVKKNNGDCAFYPKDNGVELLIEFCERETCNYEDD